ncbi:MAG: glycosyltransferase [Azonexus sp.]|jgi:rhamnosyl/mannosyltransferase|nr:glycosyltransferase [Azonexus sp.]
MKVLHFYRTYFPDTQGGLEEAIRQICASTQSHGVESRVLTLSPQPVPAVLHRPEGEVHRAQLIAEPASCSMGLGVFPRFRELQDWADVVHYHFPWPFADVVRLWSRSNKPSVVTYHSDIVRQRWLGRLYRPLMSRFLSRATRIVATSPNYARTSTVLQRYQDKLTVIPLGLDEQGYPSLDTALAADVETRFGREFFLFIGVLREYKGLQFLIEAAKDLPFPVVIAGSGPQEATLKAQALGSGNVHFVGRVSDELKVALLHTCRAVVLPSHLRSEAFGVFLLEGAMLGKPMITAETGTGTSFVNVHEETGLVCRPADADSLRQAMLRLHVEPAFCQRAGDNARQRFCQLFTAEVMGREYANLYSSMRGSVRSDS